MLRHNAFLNLYISKQINTFLTHLLEYHLSQSDHTEGAINKKTLFSISHCKSSRHIQNMQKATYKWPHLRNVSPLQTSNVVLHHTIMHYNSPVFSLYTLFLSPSLSRRHMRVSVCASLMMMSLLSWCHSPTEWRKWERAWTKKKQEQTLCLTRTCTVWSGVSICHVTLCWSQHKIISDDVSYWNIW